MNTKLFESLQRNLNEAGEYENFTDGYNKAVDLLKIIFNTNTENKDKEDAKKELDNLINNTMSIKSKFKRTIALDADKFRFQEEYEGFGIYAKMSLNGYTVSQYYLITNNSITVVSQSYNDLDKGDMYDLIDNYNSTGKFNVKAIDKERCIFYTSFRYY